MHVMLIGFEEGVMGKGSGRRPTNVSEDVIANNWDNIFQKKRRLEESDRIPDESDRDWAIRKERFFLDNLPEMSKEHFMKSFRDCKKTNLFPILPKYIELSHLSLEQQIEFIFKLNSSLYSTNIEDRKILFDEYNINIDYDPDFDPNKCQCTGETGKPLNKCEDCPR